MILLRHIVVTREWTRLRDFPCSSNTESGLRLWWERFRRLCKWLWRLLGNLFAKRRWGSTRLRLDMKQMRSRMSCMETPSRKIFQRRRVRFLIFVGMSLYIITWWNLPRLARRAREKSMKRRRSNDHAAQRPRSRWHPL